MPTLNYPWDQPRGPTAVGAPGVKPNLNPKITSTPGGFFQPTGSKQLATQPALTVPAGLDTPMRITAWDCTIGDQGVSSLALTLSVPPPSKPAVPSSLFLLQTLATLQATVAALAVGGGGGGDHYATVLVAASDSRSISADFACSGITDQETIQLAIAATPTYGLGNGNGTVLLMEGTYTTTAPIYVPQTGLNFWGMGRDTFIQGSFTGTAADDYHTIWWTPFSVPGVFTTSGSADSVMGNFSIGCYGDSARAGQELAAIFVDSSQHQNSPFIQDVTFDCNRGDGHTDQSWAYAIVCWGAYCLDVSRCGFYSGGGIRAYATNGARIHDNQFDGNQSGIDFISWDILAGVNRGGSSMVTVYNNYSDACGTLIYPEAIQPFISLVNCVGANVYGNVTDTCGIGLVIDSCFQVTVTGNGFSTYDGYGDNDLVTTGIGFLPWTVPGTFGGVKIGEHGVAVRSSFNDTGAGYVGCEAITIVGNDVSYNLHGIDVLTTGRLIQNVKIADNTASNCFSNPASIYDGGHGVSLVGSAINPINYCSITGNQISNPEFLTSPSNLPADGISISSYVNNCLIDGNTVMWGGYSNVTIPTTSSGIYAVHIKDSTCSTNQVSNNNSFGNPLFVQDSGTSSIVYGNSQAPSGGGGGGGVTSFNGRTGAVTPNAGDIEGTFTSAGQIYYGTGSGSGAALAIGSTGQVLTVSGGLPVWSTPTTGVSSVNTRTGAVTIQASDIEATFGSAGQMFYGTGANTGALLGIGSAGEILTVASGLPSWSNMTLTILGTVMTAAGQLLYGTGSGSAALLGIGSNGDVLTVVSGLPAWVASGGGGSFPPSWITQGSGNPLATGASGPGVFYFDTSSPGLWVSLSSAVGAWIQIGGSNGAVASDSVGGGVNVLTNGIEIYTNVSLGSGDIFLSDTLANTPSTGSGNGVGYFATGTDGQQSFSMFLGSTDQFDWDWNADGTQTMPDMPSTAGDAAGTSPSFNFSPARAPATTTITSGTGKQIDINHDRNVFVQTSTAGSVAVAISPDNITYYTLGTKSVTATDLLLGIYVPSAWYLKLTATGATLGTVTYY